MVLLSAVLDASIFLVMGKQLETIERQLEMIEKQFGSNWKGTEERLESKENIIGKQLKIFGNFLEQFLANYSNVWQHLVIYGISCT